MPPPLPLSQLTRLEGDEMVTKEKHQAGTDRSRQLTLGERKRSGNELAQDQAATCIQHARSQRQPQRVAAVGQRDARPASHEDTDMVTKPSVLNDSMCSTADPDVVRNRAFRASQTARHHRRG